MCASLAANGSTSGLEVAASGLGSTSVCLAGLAACVAVAVLVAAVAVVVAAASTRYVPPPLDLPWLPAWDPKQGTAGPGWDCRPGALH